MHVVRLAHILRKDAVQVFRIEQRVFRIDARARFFLVEPQILDDVAHDRDRVQIILREVIRDAAEPRVHIRAA